MPTIDETLKRLAATFVVRDIMTPDRSLVCAENETEATEVSSRYSDFSVIPIRQREKLTSYFERDTGRTKEITVDDLIGGGTSLLDLVEFLEERQFAFVLSQRRVDGYVHFSDLNHNLVKLTFYVILEAVERMVLDLLQVDAGGDEYLRKCLPAQRLKQIEKQYKRDGDAARRFFNYLNIADILRLAAKDGSIRLDERVIKDMKRMRDGAAHVLENLVADYDDVQKLAYVRRESLRILGA